MPKAWNRVGAGQSMATSATFSGRPPVDLGRQAHLAGRAPVGLPALGQIDVEPRREPSRPGRHAVLGRDQARHEGLGAHGLALGGEGRAGQQERQERDEKGQASHHPGVARRGAPIKSG